MGAAAPRPGERGSRSPAAARLQRSGERRRELSRRLQLSPPPPLRPSAHSLPLGKCLRDPLPLGIPAGPPGLSVGSSWARPCPAGPRSNQGRAPKREPRGRETHGGFPKKFYPLGSVVGQLGPTAPAPRSVVGRASGPRGKSNFQPPQDAPGPARGRSGPSLKRPFPVFCAQCSRSRPPWPSVTSGPSWCEQGPVFSDWCGWTVCVLPARRRTRGVCVFVRISGLFVHHESSQ